MRKFMTKPDLGPGASVLFVELSRLGDIVCALPAIGLLRRNYPGAKISVLTEPEYKDLIDASGYKCSLLSYPGANKLTSILKTIYNVRKKRFDLAISLSPSKRNTLVTLFSKSKFKAGYFSFVRKISGLDNCKIRAIGLSMLKPESFNSDENIAWRAVKPLSALGLGEGTIAKTLFIPRKLGLYTADYLAKYKRHDKTIAVQVSSSSRCRDWPEENFIKLFNLLQNCDIFVLGSVKDKPKVSRIIKETLGNVVPIVDSAIMQAAAVISCSDLFIGLDSGLMHIADALAVPIVAIFGPSKSSVTGPVNGTASIVSKSLDCSPCRQNICVKKIRCMSSIEPEDIFREAVKKLNMA